MSFCFTCHSLDNFDQSPTCYCGEYCAIGRLSIDIQVRPLHKQVLNPEDPDFQLKTRDLQPLWFWRGLRSWTCKGPGLWLVATILQLMLLWYYSRQSVGQKMMMHCIVMYAIMHVWPILNIPDLRCTLSHIYICIYIYILYWYIKCRINILFLSLLYVLPLCYV